MTMHIEACPEKDRSKSKVRRAQRQSSNPRGKVGSSRMAAALVVLSLPKAI
jgi:hypothetical protein